MALARDLVFLELALVDGVVSPAEGTLAVQEAVLKLALVLVAVFKDASALAVENVANLSVFLVVDNVTSPVLDDQLG